MTMIKNDEELFYEGINYVMCINPETYYPIEWADSQKEIDMIENLLEYTVSLQLFIPEIGSSNNYILSFTDVLFIRLNEDKDKLEIHYDNKGNLKVQLIRMEIESIYDITENNDVFICETHTNSFSNFAINECLKEFYNFVSNIEDPIIKELTYPIDRIKNIKEKELLNKSALNSFKANFQSKLVDFIEKIQNKEFAELKKENYLLDRSMIESLHKTINEAEKPYNRKVMHDSLQENLNTTSSNMKRNKI